MRTLWIGFPILGAAIAAAPSNRHANAARKDAVYVATLESVNGKATGTHAAGEMRFTVHGDSLTIHVHVTGVAPNIEHWQHFHGFTDARQAKCSPASADTTHDGIIDIRETEPFMGTTMVPFNNNPVGMDIPTHTYPHASAAGTYDYEKTVSLAALQSAFGAKFGGDLDLTRRVVQVHGVPESMKFPATVASLGPLPAQTTIPIACGAIKQIK